MIVIFFCDRCCFAACGFADRFCDFADLCDLARTTALFRAKLAKAR